MSELVPLPITPPAPVAGVKAPAPAHDAIQQDKATGFSALMAAADELADSTDPAPEEQGEQPAAVAIPVPPVLLSPPTRMALAANRPGPRPEAAPATGTATVPPSSAPTPEPPAAGDEAAVATPMSSDAGMRSGAATSSPVQSPARAAGQATEVRAMAAVTSAGRPEALAAQPATVPSGTTGSPAPAAAPAAATHAADDSAEPGAGDNAKGDSPHQRTPGVTISQKFNVPAVEQGPFRLDGPNLTPAIQERLAEATDAPSPAAMPPAISADEKAVSAEMPVADISIETGEGRRLDVTLSASSPDAASRLRADSHILEADLAALGAEVEAVRVELRGPRAPDGGGGSNGAPSPQTHAAQQGQADAQAQQGAAHRQPGAAASSAPARLPDTGEQEATARTAPPGGGKVDRYA